ncbi:hypothetical protein DFP73DRAFT_542326 [Morchella snyderi]|nr:hypothetical protein DFP73DRAFT_542326 [Morchella snyderi]
MDGWVDGWVDVTVMLYSGPVVMGVRVEDCIYIYMCVCGCRYRIERFIYIERVLCAFVYLLYMYFMNISVHAYCSMVVVNRDR